MSFADEAGGNPALERPKEVSLPRSTNRVSPERARHQVGVPVAAFVVPWVILAIVFVTVAFVADLAAFAPAVSAARTKAAAVLRSE